MCEVDRVDPYACGVALGKVPNMLRGTAVLVVCSAFWASATLAQAPAPPPPAGASGGAVAATYDADVLAATRKVVVRDFAGAIAALRAAASREASRPEAFCRLGDAQFVQGDFGEARAAYESCQRFATADQSGHEAARAAVGLARVLAAENKPEEERAAWQTIATTSREALAVTMAQGRLAVLDALIKQEIAYKVVRARIAERASAAHAKPAPAP